MPGAHDDALILAFGSAIAAIPGRGTARLAALAGELRLMLRREPVEMAAAGILLTAQAALTEALATRH